MTALPYAVEIGAARRTAYAVRGGNPGSSPAYVALDELLRAGAPTAPGPSTAAIHDYAAGCSCEGCQPDDERLRRERYRYLCQVQQATANLRTHRMLAYRSPAASGRG